MKIAICDDDRTYVDEIKRVINTLLYNEITDFEIDSYYNSQEIYSSATKYDIAFLDIEMQPYTGIEIAEKLKSINPYIIIFIITSFDIILNILPNKVLISIKFSPFKNLAAISSTEILLFI